MNPLSGFSTWTLALLPRLLLPGGVYLLAAVALFYAANFSGHRGRRVPRMLLKALSRENVLSMAASWVAITIVPFSDLPPLPATVSIVALLSLPLVSLALVVLHDKESLMQIAGTLAVVVATLTTTLPSKSLLPATGLEGSGWPAVVAAVLALLGIAPGIKGSINGAMRWLALGGIALIPLYRLVPFSQWTTLIALLMLAGIGLLLQRLHWTAIALYLAWIAATLAVLIALLQPS